MSVGFGPSGHSMVNALLFYYQQTSKKVWTQITTSKSEKKLPQYWLWKNAWDFRAVDNPQTLLLLIGYGAGLRVSEIVTWMERHFILRA
jgi:hypothetical protein